MIKFFNKFLNKFLNMKTYHKGFTFIELLVTMTIISIVVVAATGIFTKVIRNQVWSTSSQQLLSQTSYAMEYMSRAMRMAQQDEIGKNYNLIDKGIEFKNYKGELQKFFLDPKTGCLMEALLQEGAEERAVNFLTSGKLEVTDFKINLVDERGYQPRVTLFLDIKSKGTGAQPELKIQTTVSQRNLNF